MIGNIRHLRSYTTLIVAFAIMAHCLEETDDSLKDLGLNVDAKFEKLNVTFDVDFTDTDFLEVDFSATLRLEDVKSQPSVTIPKVEGAQFVTMAMVDPDAPSRENPVAKV